MLKINRKIIILFFLFLSTFAFAQEIEILGKVVDKTTKKGVGDVTVIVFPGGEKTQTKPNGNFYLTAEKKEGMFVQILKKGYKSLKITKDLNEIYAEILLSTEVQGQRVVVTGKKDRKKVVVSRQRLNRKQLKQNTSSVFEDTVRVVQTLPGVVSKGFSTRMYIRGGDFYELTNFYDRVYLTNPYILGGALTVFNPDVVNTVDFFSGSYPSLYHNGMSGVLDVRMRDGNSSKTTGYGEFSLTSTLGLIEGPLNEDGSDTFLVAVRRTHYDLVANLIIDRDGVQLPFFYDAHIRFKFQLGKSNILRIFSLVVYEGLDLTFDDIGDEETANFNKDSEAHYYNFRMLTGVSLSTAFSKNFIMEQTLGHVFRNGDFKFQVDNERTFDIVPSGHFLQYRNDMIIKPFDRNIFSTGFVMYAFVNNLELDIYQRGFPAGLPETFNNSGVPYQDSQVPEYTYNIDYTGKISYLPTAYFQDDIELVKDRFFMNVGINLQWLSITKNWAIDPRGGFKLSIPDVLDIKLAGGVYSQFPITKEFGRVLDEKYGNTNVKPEKSYHGVLGFEKDMKDYFIRIDFFGKYYKDLITEDYQYNFINGAIGYSYGFDFFFQKKFGDKLDGWLSYSFIISKRKVTDRISKDNYNATVVANQQKGDYELPYNTWYYPEFDRRHTLNLVVNYTFNKKWKLSTTTKFGTGLPATPLIGTSRYQIDNASDGYGGGGDPDPIDEYDYAPINGAYNSDRLPLFFNMDVKLTMPFFWDNWSMYIQIINAFSYTNVESYTYSKDYSKRKEVKGLPLIPIFGIRAEF